MSVALSIALQSDKTTAEYTRLTRQVQEHGFDGLSVYSDLGFQPPLAALLAAAGASHSLRLAPSCLNPYLLHPVEIAGQHALLDEASGALAVLRAAAGA